MQQYLIYLITAAIVLLIFVFGFAHSRRSRTKYAAVAEAGAPTDKPKHRGVYEAPGVNQQSNHPLGAVQNVIRGRIRFLAIGLLMIGVALLGLYMLYQTDIMAEYSDNQAAKLAMTVLLIGGVVWGLQLISYITYRVKLRRTGFEISSILGSRAYEYKDVDFYLQHVVERKDESEGYSPAFTETGPLHFIWVCQILFRDGRKPIILKSSRYAWLENKISSLTDALYGENISNHGR